VIVYIYVLVLLMLFYFINDVGVVFKDYYLC